MSPKYWVSSEDLSADSSLEGSHSRSRDRSDDEEGKHEDGGVSTAEGSIPRNFNDRTVAGPLGTDVTLPRLPNLQPQQHATLFYLSLIEGRCRTQAANTINAGCSPENAVPEDHPEVLGLARHLFDEMRSELVRAGLVSEDFAAPTLPDLRNYLDSFDNLLQNIATKRNFNLSAQQHRHRALPHFESSSIYSDIVPYNPGRFVLPPSSHQQNRQTGPLFDSSLFNSDFVPYNPGPLAITAPREQQLQRSPLSKLSHFFPKMQNTTLGRSLYVSDYEQLAVLGSGGFGKVYKARHRLDGAEYAIKKIVLTASHLRYLLKEKRLDRVPREIRTLARLDHHHITRYHHCWIESTPCPLPREGEDNSNNNSEFSASRVPSQSIAALSSGIQSIQFDLERDLNKQFTLERRATSTGEEHFDSSIVFSDSVSNKDSTNPHNVKHEDDSPKAIQSMFRKPGEESDSTEDATDEVEEIPRVEIAETVDVDDLVINEDFVLFIKMTPYPVTLDDFICPDLESTDKDSVIKHCFHALPAARLLLAILEGVEYLHNKKIIHRDLKPKNIFLAILDPEEKPTQGYIRIDNCAECDNKKTTKPIFVCPKLGDFGLIYELKEFNAAYSSSPGPVPPPFVSSNVGTTLYCPPLPSGKNPEPCAKLDVFSLGIIAFELLYKFGTETERRAVLSNLGKKGEVPDDFREHEMREGIVKMVCEDKNRRWSTALVREWLEGLVQSWE